MKTQVKPKTIGQLLDWSAKELKASPTPRLDARVLLGFVLKKNDAELFVDLEDKVLAGDIARFTKLIAKRKGHWPIAYLTLSKEFMGRRFEVSPKTLIPRPATEQIVRTATELARSLGAKLIVEVGTGSGAIAVSMAKDMPQVRIIATDISSAALKVAAANAEFHKVASRIKFVRTSLLRGIPPARLVVANLPYLPAKIKVSPELLREPKQALWDGSLDGLELYRQLFKQINPGVVVIELGEKQFLPMQKWLTKTFGSRVKSEAVKDIDETICGLVASFVQ